MQKMEKVFFCFFVFLAIYSCKNTLQETNASIATVYPLEFPKMTETIEKYIDTISIIPLETSEKSFLTFIQKMLLTPSGNFIILNSSGILVFDSNGRYLFTIGNKGRAPGEYLGAYDICITEDQQHLLVLANSSKILKYSLTDGTFTQQIVPQLPKEYPGFDGICPADKGGFYLFATNPTEPGNFSDTFHCLLKFDNEGRETERLLPRKDFVFSMGLITQSYDGQYIIRPQEGDNICYKAKQGKVAPYLKIDFKEKAIPQRYVVSNPSTPFDPKRFMFSDYFKLPIYLHDTEKQMYFSFCGPEALEYYCLFSKETSQGIIWQRNQADQTALFAILASDSTHFYGIYNDYEDHYPPETRQSIEPLKRTIMERKQISLGESNPVVVKIKFNI